jgi:CheY-like chemotaxis protein
LMQRHLEGYTLLATSDWEQAARFVTDMRARAVIVAQASDFSNVPPNLPVPILICPLSGPRQTAEALGIAAYLRKPIEIETLQTALRNIAPQARSLLIVDDEPSMVRLTERMVLADGATYQIFRAYSGNEALARIQAQVPDAVLLDLNMPDGDGLGLINTLQQNPETANILIIAISGQTLEDTGPRWPISVVNAQGFSATETLNYLQAILSAIPPLMEHYTSAPPLSADRSA